MMQSIAEKGITVVGYKKDDEPIEDGVSYQEDDQHMKRESFAPDRLLEEVTEDGSSVIVQEL